MSITISILYKSIALVILSYYGPAPRAGRTCQGGRPQSKLGGDAIRVSMHRHIIVSTPVNEGRERESRRAPCQAREAYLCDGFNACYAASTNNTYIYIYSIICVYIYIYTLYIYIYIYIYICSCRLLLRKSSGTPGCSYSAMA